MELCVNQTNKENIFKRKQKSEDMGLSKHTDFFKMSWSQKAHNIFIVLIRINPLLDFKKISITLTDQSCTLNAPGMRKYGWDFFLEVDSKTTYTNQNSDKFVISIAKKDPTLRWPSFYKTVNQGSMCADENNYSNNKYEAEFSDEQPPEKIHITADHRKTLNKNEVIPANVTMSTGTVVTNGILKGGNRPILGNLTTSASSEQNLESGKLVGSEDCDILSHPDIDSYHYLKEIENEWHETGENGIICLVHVSNIDPWSLKIKLFARELMMLFKTGCEEFHEKHKTDSSVTFCWKINLSGDILPSKSEYRLNADKLTFLLYKKQVGEWKTLFRVQPENQSKGDGRMVDATKSTSNRKSFKKPNLNKYTGLQNLGNTCFINSVLQCLANTKELRDYFLDKSYCDDLNPSNPLGMKGKMAESFYSLLQEMCSGKHQCFAPTRFRQTVGLKAPQFIDYMQHDAQEFMAWLMDILHEDVNRVLQKPYYEVKEQEEECDSVVVENCWKLHKSRNDSFIVDLFHGMLKSKLVCPVCEKHSNKFDPFLFLPVPLPLIVRQLNIIFHYKEPDTDPVKISVWIPKTDGICEKILNAAAKVTGVKSSKMRIYEVYNNSIHKLFLPLASSDKILSTDILFIQEMLMPDDCGEGVYEIFVNQRRNAPDILQQCVFCKKQASEGSIKRCLRCYKVGYCDQKCQKSDWPQHRSMCKRVIEKIGLPFVALIPHSKATYKNTVQLFNKLAQKSVQVSCYEKGESQINLNKDVDPDCCGNFFSLIPTNWSGETVSTLPVIKPSDDDPNRVLDLSKYMVIGMDWHTDPKLQCFVKVANKSVKRSVVLSQPPPSPTLYDCLQLFTEPEVLTPNEAWYCPNCKEHREATKQLSLCKLPDVLIIQLKRFSFKNFLWRDKITTLVDFPIKGLDMSSYCEGENIYDLHSVVNHHGEIFGGHYTSNVYSDTDSKWRICDDGQISEINLSDVVTKVAYVMFYRRRKTKIIEKRVHQPSTISSSNHAKQKLSKSDCISSTTNKASFSKTKNMENNVENMNNTTDNSTVMDSINNNTTVIEIPKTEMSNDVNRLADNNETSDSVYKGDMASTSKALLKEDIVLQETAKEINHMGIDDRDFFKTKDFLNEGEASLRKSVTEDKALEIAFTDMDEID